MAYSLTQSEYKDILARLYRVNMVSVREYENLTSLTLPKGLRIMVDSDLIRDLEGAEFDFESEALRYELG